MRNLKLVLLAGLFATGSAWGQNVDNLFLLNQAQFRLLSEDLGGALSYQPQTPTEPLGFPGLDIGVAVSGAKLKNREVAELASSESVDSTILIPTVRANVGLPLGFDIGALMRGCPTPTCATTAASCASRFSAAIRSRPPSGCAAASRK